MVLALIIAPGSSVSFGLSTNRPEGKSIEITSRLLKQGQEKMAPWLEKVNAFYADQWPIYQEHVKQTDLSPFKETESFKLN